MNPINHFSHRPRWFKRAGFAIALFIAIGAYMNYSTSNATLNPAPAQVNTTPFVVEKNGRRLSSLSIHPNSREWLFSECVQKGSELEACHILRYHLDTKELKRYDLPAGYDYAYPNFSPKGTYILASRFPRHYQTDASFRASIAQGELVLMRADGSDFQVLPIPQGRYVGGAMSPDETKVAYWRSALHRPEGRKSTLADFDIYEYDLRTKTNQLFAGEFKFFEAGNLQYLSEDEVLVGAWGPDEHASAMSLYDKKFNESHVYKFKRGQTVLPEPVFTHVHSAQQPSVDGEKNTYLRAEYPKGLAFLKIGASGQIDYWPLSWTPSYPRATAAPDGRYLAFVYMIEPRFDVLDNNALGFLDLQTSHWLPVSLPALERSTLIPVKNVQ